MMASSFLDIKHPGILRGIAAKEGLIHGKEKLSSSDLAKLKKSKNPKTRQRATLAETMRGWNHK